jgi:dihydrolipoamide dehydrogenase
MELKLSTKVTGVAVEGKTVTLDGRACGWRRCRKIEADCVLVAIGRKPNTDGLGLDKIGLELNKRGQIETDHDFRTNGVWAIGDVIPGPMLAHKAEDEGIAVAENIAGLTGIVNHDVIPGVVYTFPEFAGVGLTQEAAKAAGRQGQGRQVPDAGQQPRQDQPRARRLREDHRRRQDRPRAGRVGIASVAGTMIAEAAQPWSSARPAKTSPTCHAHPTHSEAIKEAAMAMRGKPIHLIGLSGKQRKGVSASRGNALSWPGCAWSGARISPLAILSASLPGGASGIFDRSM